MANIVNGAKLIAAQTAYEALFKGRLAEERSDHVSPYVMDRRSTSEIEKYHFMDPLSKMELFSGNREYQRLSAQAFLVQNEVYSKGVEISIDAINDDRLDIVEPTIMQLADLGPVTWNALLAEKLRVGEVAGNLSYDGAIFFSAAHPRDGALADQKNTDTGVSLTATNFAAAVETMESLTDSKGDPIDVFPTVLMVPPALRAEGEAIVKIGPLLVGGNGDPNPNYQRTDLVVNPYLTNTTDWYLFDLRHVQKPFVRQMRSDPIFSMDTSPNAESVKQRRVVEAYSEMRGAVDYALWQFAYKGQA